jgi:GAF domain-containing protein
LSQKLIRSHCPHCHVDHSWSTKDAKLVAALPPSVRVEDTKTQPGQRVVGRASLRASLGALVHTAIENAAGEARAAFYISNGAKLHHIIGMPEAYARQVDGFAIGQQSLACGLAAARRQPIITRDVAEEPLWKPWLWLAKQFDYRACWSFPVETSEGDIVGTFAMYFRDPREATPRDLDLAATITRAAAIMISPQLADQ